VDKKRVSQWTKKDIKLAGRGQKTSKPVVQKGYYTRSLWTKKQVSPWIKKDIKLADRGRKQISPYACTC